MGKTIPSQDFDVQCAKRAERLKRKPICSKCGEKKTIADFPKRAVDYWCSACRRIYAQQQYHVRRAALSDDELQALKANINKRQTSRRKRVIHSMTDQERKAYYAKINAENKSRRDDVRDTVFNAYGGYVCACCGEKEIHFLSLDHINNDGAAHKRKHGFRTVEQMHRWIVRENFPPMFQVLCMNCNWGKRNNNGICPHQSKV